MKQNYQKEASVQAPNFQSRPDLSRASQEGVDLNDNFGSLNQEKIIQESKPMQNTRPEMKGPSEVNNILSGLKTRQVNMGQDKNEKDKNNLSTISVEDLRELAGTRLPKSRRKQKSDKNSISLDI